MKHSSLKRIVVGTLCSLVVVIGAYGTAPKAYAFPVVVTGDIPRVLFEKLEAVGWLVAKTALDSMTQSIVNWINSGFQGSPAFVTDLNRNLGNLADAVAEDFLRGLDQVVVSNTGISIRAPFQDQITRALREEFYRTTSSYGFDVRNQYRDCYQGQGFSLNGWFCQSQDPSNNVYGRYMLARNQLFAELDSAARNRITELGWGKGFMSWRGPCGRYGTEAAQTGVNLSQRDSTVGCPIRTPGTVIEQSLGITATSPLRQLELADDFDEILGALMNQLVNQILGGGGLIGTSQPSAGGGPSYIDRTSSSSVGFGQQLTKTQTQFTTAQTGWQRVLDAANQAARACASNSTNRTTANDIASLATTQLAATNTALTELRAIEAERVRLSNAGTTTGTDVDALVRRYTDLLSKQGGALAGEDEASNGPIVTQMTQLAASCR